jgi:hypothetical protein
MNSIRATRRLMLLVLAGTAIAFTARLLRATPEELASSRALITSGGVIALAFLFSVCLGMGREAQPRKPLPFRTGTLVLLTIAVVFACYGPVLSVPLLHDSYTHVVLAQTQSWRTLLNSFVTHPTSGDFFFRPLGYASFLLDSHWAGFSPLRWHLWNVCVHAINAGLVLILARRLSFSPVSATAAAILFAIHGSRPEVVAWVAARFDLLACLFSLLSLLCLDSYVKARRFRWASLTLLFAVLAVFSKESAYCLPLIMLVLAFFYDPVKRRLVYRLAALCGGMFFALLIYRFWLLRGPGGYQTHGGAFDVLNFNPVRTLNALFFREWSLLFFPVNWSTDVGALLKFAAVGSVIALVCIAILVKASDRRLIAALVLVFVASLPVQHLLLIGPDLNGARVLYLPVLGVCLFWGLLFELRPEVRTGGLLLATVLAAQAIYLEHNLGIWKQTAILSRDVCASFGKEVSRDHAPVFVQNLPHKRNGVFFLSNGFPQCVAMNSGIPSSHIRVIDGNATEAPGNASVFEWNDAAGELVRAPRK